MDASSVIEAIKRHRAELEAAGVAHVYLFGSVLHGDAGADSDVDLLFDQNLEKFGLIEYARLKRIASESLPFEVDFIERSCLDPKVSARVVPEAQQIF